MSAARISAAIGAAAASLVLAAGPSFAGSPHFIGNLTKASLAGTDLVVQFKEAGLESGSVETIQATAHLEATYQCINGGGNNPADPKKTTISEDVSQSGQFTAGKNGQVSDQLMLSVPAASTVLDCPGGQTSTLTAGTWSNVSIADLTSGASLAIPGEYSFGSPVGHGNH